MHIYVKVEHNFRQINVSGGHEHVLVSSSRVENPISRSWRRSHLRVLRRSGRCVCASSVSGGISEIQNKQKQMCFLEMRLRVRMSRAGGSVRPILLSRPGFPALPSFTPSGRLQPWSRLVMRVICVLYACYRCSPGPDFLLLSQPDPNLHQ